MPEELLRKSPKTFSPFCAVVLNAPFCPVKQKLRKKQSEVSMVKIPQHKGTKKGERFRASFSYSLCNPNTNSSQAASIIKSTNYYCLFCNPDIIRYNLYLCTDLLQLVYRFIVLCAEEIFVCFDYIRFGCNWETIINAIISFIF